MATLNTKIWGIDFKNPVWSASGCFGYGTELADFFAPDSIGGIVTKGISATPWPGNPPPRIVETPCGMLNSIGLQNVGLQSFIDDKMPPLRELDTKVVVNFLGHRIEEYEELAEALNDVAGIDVLEINLSCPNVDKGGLTFSANPEAAAEVVRRAKIKAPNKPLLVKLSPNTGDIGAMSRAVADAGADGISLINTLLGMAININTRRPVLHRVVGGLSGPAVRPVALRMVWEAAKSVNIPVVGMGGIETAEDVIAFMLAGASAVQIGTAVLRDPMAMTKILEDLNTWCDNQGISDISDIIGALEV